jgi:AcrR family transcriptional regulator
MAFVNVDLGGNQTLRDTLQQSGDPRVTRTRAMILDAVRALSVAGGELSVTSIVRTAGVSRATFYSHYAGLDELANSLRSNAFVTIGDLYLSDRHETSDALHLSQERLVAHFADNRALYSAVAALPVSKGSYLTDLRAMTDVIAEALFQHPGFPAGLRVEVTARYIAGAAYGLLDAWIGAELDLTEGELVEHLTRLLPSWFSGGR